MSATLDAPTIDLACLSCGITWTEPRRRGQYALRCLHCRSLRRLSPRDRARRLQAYANRRGLHVTARGDGRHGWSVWVTTPWHDRPVILRDEVDIDYLAAELGQERR